MRWTHFPPICLCLLLSNAAWCQFVPDLSQARDPADFSIVQIFEQLDTISSHRRPIALDFLEEEFPKEASITIETYFQKSDQHALLRLGSNRIRSNPIFLVLEGWGTTFVRISDNQCSVIQIIHHDRQHTRFDPLYRDCLF